MSAFPSTIQSKHLNTHILELINIHGALLVSPLYANILMIAPISTAASRCSLEAASAGTDRKAERETDGQVKEQVTKHTTKRSLIID